jgi:thymidylate kinase
MPQRGLLFVFEGVDGAGKSRLAMDCIKPLQDRGIEPHPLSFPGKSPNTLGNLVYRIHHRPQDLGIQSLTSSSLQTLHLAAHLDAIETIIIPRLEAGNCVVLDRYWWSTWVYGLVGGMQRSVLDALINVERIAWGRWLPTSVFYITRATPLRSEPIDTWEALKNTYEELLSSERKNYPVHIIDNDAAPEEALKQVLNQIAGAKTV